VNATFNRQRAGLNSLKPARHEVQRRKKTVRRVVVIEDIPGCRVEHQVPKESEGEDEFILIIDEREFEPEEIDISILRGKATDLH
jgi:hypothetical protein